MLLAIRRRRPGEPDIAGRRQPVAQVHVDQTTASSIARVHRHLPAPDVPKLLEGRFQIINLWRPIAVPALDWPLALCDYRSVDLKTDTFPVAHISAQNTGETMRVKYNENHKWNYLHGMTPEEIVLIKWQVAFLFCSNLLFYKLVTFGLSADLFLLLYHLALIPFGMGVLPFARHTRVSVTHPPPMEHPFASQLNFGPLSFMTEYLGLGSNAWTLLGL